MKINKKYQGGGINKKRMGDHSQMLVNPEPLIPEVGSKGDTRLRTMKHGGKMKYDEGGKSKETFSGHIYDSLEEANEALKDGSYKKNASKDERRNNKYVINFKGDDGKIHKKTFRPYNDGGMMNVKYGHGGKTTMAFLQDGGKPELDEFGNETEGFDEDKYQLYKKTVAKLDEFGNETEGKKYSSKGLKEMHMKGEATDVGKVKKESDSPVYGGNQPQNDEPKFDPGVDRQTTEEAGNPTKNLITENPSGDKWLGDKRPPMYGASEEHIPFLTTVYEMMDAGENMDQMYHSQEYLRPYIKYIIAGQNETVLPSLENAEGSKNKKEEGKGKLPAFMQNMSKDEIMNVLKESFGGVRQMKE
tara:strand:- start:123 stop:1199 length:1077 start_codon:yes stop_codon:yes gene_type:complete